MLMAPKGYNNTHIILTPASDQIRRDGSENLSEDLSILLRRPVPQVDQVVRERISYQTVFAFSSLVLIPEGSWAHEGGDFFVMFAELGFDEAEVLAVEFAA